MLTIFVNFEYFRQKILFYLKTCFEYFCVKGSILSVVVNIYKTCNNIDSSADAFFVLAR
jgi:hypothetical protein